MIEEKSISIENNQGVLLHSGQSGLNTKEWEVIQNKKPNSIRLNTDVKKVNLDSQGI